MTTDNLYAIRQNTKLKIKEYQAVAERKREYNQQTWEKTKEVESKERQSFLLSMALLRVR